MVSIRNGLEFLASSFNELDVLEFLASSFNELDVLEFLDSQRPRQVYSTSLAMVSRVYTTSIR